MRCDSFGGLIGIFVFNARHRHKKQRAVLLCLRAVYYLYCDHLCFAKDNVLLLLHAGRRILQRTRIFYSFSSDYAAPYYRPGRFNNKKKKHRKNVTFHIVSRLTRFAACRNSRSVKIFILRIARI